MYDLGAHETCLNGYLEAIASEKSLQKTLDQAVYGQANPQKIQGGRNIFRKESRQISKTICSKGNPRTLEFFEGYRRRWTYLHSLQ